MALFQYGFIVWGLFAVYAVVFVAYLLWASSQEKRDLAEGGSKDK
ncbi:MAG: hypothetical protein ACM3X4_01755 [Ignavibacteriales bacterium]